MIKRMLCTLLALAILVPSAWASTAEAKTSDDFQDLKDLDAATKAKFDALIEAGIFNGIGEGQFGLKDEMNRAQFAKVAALIFGLKVDSSLKTSSFSDVRADDAANGYALPFIEAVKAAGITDGYGDGVFNPAGTVTKEQLATFLVRGLGQREEAEKSDGVEDPTVSEWAKGYVALALEKKLLTTGEDGSFGGKTNVIREDLVLITYDTKQVVEQMKEEEKKAEEEKKKAEEEAKKEEEAKQSTPSPSPSPSPWPSDTTAPSFAADYPRAGEIQAPGSKQAQILVQANEGGTAYYVVVAGESPAPSASQVIAGQDSTGNAALASANASLAANTELSLVTAALPSDNAMYDAYVVVRDAAYNASAVARVSLETPTQAIVATPIADRQGGTVTSNTYITLTSPTEGASIYYTIDNSTPTTESTPYAEPIWINTEVTIKAIAVKTGMLDSEVMSESYSVDSTVPYFEVQYPLAGDLGPAGSKQVSIKLRISEDARAYYVVVPDDAPSPSVAQVLAGLGGAGEEAMLASHVDVTGNATVELTIVFEADATPYDVYFILMDAAGNATSESVMVHVTTPPATYPN